MPYTEEEAYANAKHVYRDLSDNRLGMAEAAILGFRNDAKSWAGYVRASYPQSPKLGYLWAEIHDDTDHMLELMTEAKVDTWTPELEQKHGRRVLRHTAGMLRRIEDQGNFKEDDNDMSSY